MTNDKPERRRGSRLEEAILDAAWLELYERGYGSLTLEGVAGRAGTSRPVLSRRWPNRSALAIAALGRYYALNPVVIPDLGNLRDEVRFLLRQMSNRARPDMVRLVYDLQKDLAESHSNLALARAQIIKSTAIETILARAAKRGEISARRLHLRIVTLPTDLAREEILMTFEPLTDRAIDEIVDEIFLPLVRHTGQHGS